MRIDLNADVGEGCGGDDAIVPHVTSVNIAGGGHAGGGAVLEEAVAIAARHNVTIGAHPSYPDRENFGRLSLPVDSPHFPTAILFSSLMEQIAAVQQASQRHGVECRYVKPHGALYNDAFSNVTAANLVLAATVECGGLPVMGQPGSVLEREAKRRGVGFVAEGFADRRYLPDGRLAPRSVAAAVFDRVDDVVRQALSIALSGQAETVDGGVVPLTVGSLCLHGDSPEAVASAAAVREALQQHGVDVRSFLD